jgi:hypothetical protein
LETNTQLDLFSPSEINSVAASRKPVLLMDVNTLTKWKSQITVHQQQVRTSESVQQITLFNVPSAHVDPDIIDPFNLQPCPLSFYRLPADSPGQACLYFVVDMAANLLLYVGETCKSNKRWKGVHDCKRYIEMYLDLHYRYNLKTAVNIAFWWDAPVPARPRQKLELALIQKWKSPFNKENWRFWGQPFG